MDTRHPVACSIAAPLAAEPLGAEPLGPSIPAVLGSRREFCIAACQALSLGAIAATLQACGGGGLRPDEHTNSQLHLPASTPNPAAKPEVGPWRWSVWELGVGRW
jgi:hypothetical protein